MPNERKSIPVPSFASLDEERAWFEKHAEEAQGTELKDNPFAGHTAKVAYSLRLDAADVERLEAAAERRGMRPTQLARHWLTEQLTSEEEWTRMDLESTQQATRQALLQGRNELQHDMTGPPPRWREQHRALVESVLVPMTEQWSAVFVEIAWSLSANMTAEQIAEAAIAASASKRTGQAVFEFVRVLRPNVAAEVRGTDADPSEDDGRVPMFFERVAELAAA